MRSAALALVLLLVGATAGAAQALPARAEMRATAALQASGPAFAPATERATFPDLLPASQYRSRRQGETLMIVGGAALLGGIIVGGSGGAVLALGGIGVGAYGVYLYTR
ncbi:MAG TPA: hypothetical protein VGR60_02000 [Gemmatimonadales bacterium]|nr:hypothetical protein [Gemmatimonadales bacterium]